MVKIYRRRETEEILKQGYSASYVADLVFRKKLDSAGIIYVSVVPGEKSQPHAHGELEEVFVAMSKIQMTIDGVVYDLAEGDVVLVSPNEVHSFEAPKMHSAHLLAMKFPNLKSDKISSDNQ